MEILLILGFSAALDAGLLLFLLIRSRLQQPFLLLAVGVNLFVLLQALAANLPLRGLVINHYGLIVALYAWLLYLQSLYLQIPNRPWTRYGPLALVNLLLFALFLFQFQIDRISGALYFDITTLMFAGIFTSISMLFFIENLIRHLKPERRYAFKHLLFLLLVLALIHLLYFHQRLTYPLESQMLMYLLLLVQLPLPLFVGISAARIQGLEDEAHFLPGREGQVQYFMVLIGAGLLLAGAMQMLDFYFSEVRSNFYHAILLMLLLIVGGLLLLSDLFRSEINLWLRAYFLGDPTDYRREWQRVTTITRHEEGIEQRILEYYLDCLDAREGALYLADRQRLRRAAQRGTGFDDEFRLERGWETDTEMLGPQVHCLKEGRGWGDLLILLGIDERIQAICRLRSSCDPQLLGTSLLSLCETVSNEFAIRLGEIQQKRRLQRQEKLAGFNRTVAFLAHDLKNILAQQRLALENYAKYREDPEFLDDFCDTIEHSTRKLEDLIAQFRYKSLNSVGDTVSLRQLIDFLLHRKRLYGERLELDLPESPDEEQPLPRDLQMVADNLLKNALEASPPDQPVRLRLRCNKGHFKLRVCDRGRGMSQDFIRNQLFEPFVSTKEGKGLGVGMYHVRNIVDGLNGQIDVESKPGKGTCITVETACQ